MSEADYRPAAVYRRLLRYAAPYWRMFLLAVLSMALFSATDGGMAWLLKPLTDGSFVKHDPVTIRWMPWAILGLFLVRGLANLGSTYAMAWLGQKVVATLRADVFEHLLLVPVTHHDRARSADLQTKLTYQAAQVSDAATSVLTSVIRSGLSALALLATMIYTSWQLTLAILLIVPPIFGSFQWVNRRFRTLSNRIQTSIGGINHSADQVITGRRMVKVYGGESLVLDAFARINDYLRRQTIKLSTSGAVSSSVMELLAATGIASLVFLATLPALHESLTAGDFVRFIGAMLMLRQPLSSLADLSQRLQRGLVAGADLFVFLDTPRERDSGTRRLSRAHGEIEFANVCYRYDNFATPALDGVSLHLAAGQRVALVGRSGSGKSTLLSLIPRFYDPDSGRVCLDGHDLREYRLADLRRQIALVDQSVVLFNASIAENIAYGIGLQTDQERIVAAAKAANAWDFIERLRDGIHTPVGQGGVLLSGGERQRIAIARALLKDAPILLLDEATSALDSESEQLVQDALGRLVIGRTVLVIAHRLSTVQNADRIAVMQDGRIVEQGTHMELLTRDGAYATQYRLQFRQPAAAAV
ncbi:MAG: lipid A export permease/ATP-binding protein MsbA [Gammaproteobacteria bacterium]|nr:lipid A export permease/ATP-binding protein MsbA [Gammaproteobacteria bacterium]